MCRLLHNALLFLFAVLPTGVLAQGGIDFHPIAGQTYVIMNAETGEFLYRYSGLSGKYPFMTKSDESSMKDGNTFSDLKTLADKNKFDLSALLWGIQPSAAMDFSYYIYNKEGGKKYYLTTSQNGFYYYYNLTATDSTKEYPFYFIRSEFNRDGYKVSTDAGFSKGLWYCTYSSSGTNSYYLYDTHSDGLSMTKVSGISEGDPKYDLGSFCFFTYDDLWNKYIKIKNDTVNGHCLAGGGILPYVKEATNHNKATGTDFYYVISALRSFAQAHRFKPLFGNRQRGLDRDTLLTQYLPSSCVIKSRRFNTYLARKRNGSLYLSKSIDKDCVWSFVSTVDTAGNDRYALMSMSNQNNTTSIPYLTIGRADPTHAWINIAAASDCDPKYCSLVSYNDSAKLISFYPGTVAVPTTNNGYGQYEETIKTSSTDASNFIDDLPVDWVTCSDWKIVKYDDVNNEHVALTDDQLRVLADTVKTNPRPFFRIENVAYSIQNWGAGWLADVDHRDEITSNHFLATGLDDDTPLITDKNNNKNTNMPLIDIVSTTESKAWAPNLWRLELVRKGTGNGKDFPIGVVSNTSHNLYQIKNANSGKYICVPDGYLQSDTTYQTKYFTLKKNPTIAQKAYFWLEDLGEGQYALALRDPVKNTNLNYSDNAVGYAIIKDYYKLKLTDKSGTKSDVEIGPYTAGLYFWKEKPAVNSRGAFSFEQAFTLEAFTGDNDDTGKEAPTYRYVTAYYPFAVKLLKDKNADKNTGIFKAVWADANEQKVRFSELDYLPKNTGGIVFYPYDNAISEVVTFELNPDTTKAQNTKDNVLTGVTEAEDKWFSKTQDAIDGEYPKSGDDRFNYLVFSSWKYTSSSDATGSGTTLGLFHPLDAYPMTNRCYIDLTTAANANCKTYLNNQNPSPAKGSLIPFSFDDIVPDNTPTSIARIPETVRNDGAWYDLQGRRTWFPTHGIYIHNGKKILIR